MKKILIVCIAMFGLFVIGCSSTNDKWTFNNEEYDMLLNDAKLVKDNYDMYVEKESRKLDYSEELESNVELTMSAKENINTINDKYEGKLTEEEISLLADLSLCYRYIGNVFKSDDRTTIKKIDVLQEKILQLEEE